MYACVWMCEFECTHVHALWLVKIRGQLQVSFQDAFHIVYLLRLDDTSTDNWARVDPWHLPPCTFSELRNCMRVASALIFEFVWIIITCLEELCHCRVDIGILFSMLTQGSRAVDYIQNKLYGSQLLFHHQAFLDNVMPLAMMLMDWT